MIVSRWREQLTVASDKPSWPEDVGGGSVEGVAGDGGCGEDPRAAPRVALTSSSWKWTSARR